MCKNTKNDIIQGKKTAKYKKIQGNNWPENEKIQGNNKIACGSAPNKAKENGTYTLSLSSEEVGFNYLHLIDNMTDNDIDLLQTPSYSFEARTTDYASRFRLVFSICEDANGDNEAFAFISNGNIIVDGEGVLQVVDMTGRVVVSGDAKHCVSTIGMTAGVYVLRLVNGNNVKTQKIVIQ